MKLGKTISCLILFICVACHSAAAAPGNLDGTFLPSITGSSVSTSALQPDGKILIGGTFSSVSGQSRNNIARINQDGTLDITFNPGLGTNGSVTCIAVQSDGKILIGGSFTSVDGESRKYLARLLPDGALESSATFDIGSGGSNPVSTIVVQPDGKILIGGRFTSWNGYTQNRLARLNVDGTTESSATFDVGSGPSDEVTCIDLQPDGKILIGGTFETVNGQARSRVARLAPDGSVESTATFDVGTGPSAGLNSIAIQPDGRILIAGFFTSFNNEARGRIARLESNGSLESTSTFASGSAPNGAVESISLQIDGKIIVTGNFTVIYGQARNRIARFGPDGILEDTVTFAPPVPAGPGGALISDAVLQQDGAILLAGAFESLGGESRTYFARLVNDAASQTISVPDSSSVIWMRGGSGPEVRDVTFELSTDGGASWTQAGSTGRIPGGWETTGLSLPADGAVRFQGHTTGGGGNGSSGLIEMVQAFPDSPEIVVEVPAGKNISNGANTDFGTVALGATSSRTYTIKNIGTQNLTGLGVTVDGPDAGMFSVTTSPSAPLTGPFGETSMVVEFTPASAGNKVAALHIASNDSDENPFDITLSGRDTTIDADLTDLAFSSGTVSPIFSTDVTDYTVVVPGSTSSITMTPTASQSISTISINGVDVSSGVASPAFDLNVGINVFTVVVSAGDGVTTKTYTSTVLRPAGGLDLSFDANLSVASIGSVFAIAVQPDGKIVIGGDFNSVGGQAYSRIARLDRNGNLDTTFDVGTGASGSVKALIVQPDGKIIAGGTFISWNGQSKNCIVRLNSDGTLDPAFDVGTGAPGGVLTVALQPDGKILLGGAFSFVNGQPRQYLARLEADGTLEDTASFNVVTPSGFIRSLALQQDGKIVMLGDFGTVNGQTRSKIARLHPDGSLEDETSFPGPGVISGRLYCAAIQPDGKLVIGGGFTSVGGQTRNYIARLHSNGALEDSATFNPGTGATNDVLCVSLQTDGKILIGGQFTNVNNVSGTNQFARLNADGSVESPESFNKGGVGSTISTIALQADGKILVGGFYVTQTVRYLARLANNPATQAITIPNNSRVEWARGGAAPEVGPVSVELSTDDGAIWTYLGSATRVAGGWELAGLSLPATGAIRVRGRTSVSLGSSGIIETVVAFPAGPEIVVEQPFGTPLTDGTTRNFSAADVGATSNLTFTIKSIGTVDLTGITITKDGPDADQFTVTSSPIAPVSPPTGSTTFTVQFAPTSVGTKTAVIHIDSNDADESPFDITLVGVGRSLDPGFGPIVTGTEILALAVQSGGKTVVGGNFSEVGGQVRNHVARLLSDGSVESTLTFDLGVGANGPVNCAAMQRDGKVIIAGAFTEVNGEARNGIARLNVDGTLENTSTFDPGTGVDGPINGMALQPDGRILIVGDFANVNGQPRTRIARLNVDGSVEATGTFNVGAGASAVVNSVAVQANGLIVLGGDFLSISGQARSRIARLHPNGVLEDLATFNPGAGADSAVSSVAIQADQRILFGGTFTTVDGETRNGIARLETDGSIESLATFDPGSGADGNVSSIAMQADGKFIIGGAFTMVNEQSRGRIARLFSNGTLEDTLNFNPGTGADGVVNAVALQEDGKILMAGAFANVNGSTRNRIARFGNEAAVQTLAVPNSALVQWTRGGTAPEVEQVTFELSTDFGANWTPVGTASRITGGWEGAGLSLPAVGTLRARGRTVGGFSNGSSGLVEQLQIFSNPPVAVTDPATAVMATTATLNATVTPNGDAMVHFEYGPTDAYGISTVPQPASGAVAVTALASITGLTGNLVHHYRVVATNDAGTTFGDDISFTTAPDPPLTITGSPTAVTSTSATLIGSINPKGRETTVYFEYGPTTLYGSNTPPQIIPAGGTVVEVSAPLNGLDPNSNIHYRLIASSTGGSAIGDDVSFITNFPPPEATTGSAAPLTTTSAQVNGTARANNTTTSVFFDYGTDGITFPNSVTATPATVSGDLTTDVTADLTNLLQGVTYHYRVRAVSAGGTTNGNTSTLTLDILSGLTQSFPPAPSPAQGFVFITLNPFGITSGWRFIGETTWRESSTPISVLATGDRIIEFRPVPGHIQPPPEVASVVSGGAPLVLTRDYYESAGGGAAGGMIVTLKPTYLAESTVPETDRIQWRLLGEDETQWRDSGVSLSNLSPGSYLVECKPVSGRTTPRTANVVVTAGETAAPTLTYFLSGSSSGALPTVLPFETVTTNQSLPYAYVGQIRSNVGSSTGFVVKPRVVATAGHVVFDDGILASVTGLQWLFQRDSSAYEPRPQTPRGYYLFDGYAAARSAPGVIPGEGTQESQNLDVAALYFVADSETGDPNLPGRGGYGGFLASDSTTNEFLLSPAQKILVGYPVEGISPSLQGRMHATTPLVGNPAQVAAFTQVFDRTYVTPDLRSNGGMSGAPLYIQHDGGNYYAAAVYLGGTGQTIVRSIDSDVIELFNRAQTSGNGDGNNTSGGITHTSITGTLNTANPGALQILIEPAAAIAAGAGWRLKPDTTYRPNAAIVSGLNPATYILELATVAGYPSPEPQNITVTGGQLKTITYSYEGVLTEQESWRLLHFGSSTNTGDGADEMDPDNDNRTNVEEFTANTDPNDPNDFFRVISRAHTLPNYTLTINGKTGRTYTLQRNATLSPELWTDILSEGPLTSDAPVNLNDADAPTDATTYYRIKVTVPLNQD